MRKWTWLIFTLIFFSAAASAAGKALVLTIDGAIGPATQDYVQRGIKKAGAEKMGAIIIQMNTPGGLGSSMRGINRAIIGSPVPVLTFVMPSGAHAASAGTFILYASHIAAMAPGTNLGAASPVSIGGDGGGSSKKAGKKQPKSQSDTLKAKATNDAAAYIRSLAELRGRNIAWAKLAVTKAASLSAKQALKKNVIDFIVNNDRELLQKADGRKVMMVGAKQTLKTKNLSLEYMAPDWRNEFLGFITNPNIAYLLMLAAMYGLFFELANPGAIVPGVIGVISLLLALYAFQLMPVNYAGLLLLIVGLGFMITEFYVSGFGLLGIGGVVAFAIGSVMLFDIHDADYRISWALIGTMSITSALLVFAVLSLAVRSHKKAVVSGKEALIGSEGVVINVMNEQVIVQVLGEMWEASSTQMLNRGDKVRIISADGLKLVVEKISD